MNNRRGVSLIELTINLTAASVLMLLSVSAVHSVMSIRSRTSELTDHSRSVARLALQLRRDVHSAESAEMKTENELLLRLGKNEVVSYRVAPEAIVRRSSVTDSSNPEDSSHERFTLRSSTLAELAISQDLRTIELVISRQIPSRTEQKMIENKIRAVVGLWRVETVEGKLDAS